MQLEFPQQGHKEAFAETLGAQVHYLQAGSGRPMLLIHGLVGSSSNWRRNIDALAKEACVYAIDLVNVGKSQRVEGLDADIESTADRIAAFMDAVCLPEADIAGHSYGGAVAMMLAARHPERVRSLILFAPANPYSDLSDFLVRAYSTPLGRLVAAAAPYLPAPLQRFALGRMYGDPARIPAGTLEGYIKGLRLPGSVDHVLAIVRNWFADMAKLKAALPCLVDVPTLLVWGDCDRAVSVASGMRLNGELPASQIIAVLGGGHVVFEEMPAEANRLMTDWLRRDPVSNRLLAPDQSNSAPQRHDSPLSDSIAACAAMESLPTST